MKLLYLTNVQIPADDAQSLQVRAMSKAFYLVLGNDFLLVSPLNERNKDLKTDYQWRRIKIPKFFPRALRQLLLIIKALPIVFRFRPEVIYSRDIGIVLVYKILGFKPVYEIHKPFVTKIGEMIFRIIAKKIKIVAISNALKNFLLSKYFTPRKSAFVPLDAKLSYEVDLYSVRGDPRFRPRESALILVAPDGVFLEDFEKITDSKEFLKKKYLGLEGNKFVILYSGSLQKGKGVTLILKAGENLKDVYFVILGSEKPKNEYKITSNVLFLGRKDQKEIPYYLKSADLLILPNTKELSYYQYTSPLKMFEYLASGVPILASRLGSLLEVLNEENAFLFDPENLNDLVEKIQFIRNNYQEAQKRAKKALEDVKNYTWQKRVERILEFLKC